MILYFLLLSLIINFLCCKSIMGSPTGPPLSSKTKFVVELHKSMCCINCLGCGKYDCSSRSYLHCRASCLRNDDSSREFREVFNACDKLCVDERENCKRRCLADSDFHRKEAIKLEKLLEEGLLKLDYKSEMYDPYLRLRP